MEELPPLVPDLTAWFEALLARVAALESRSEQGGAAATAKAEAQDKALQELETQRAADAVAMSSMREALAERETELAAMRQEMDSIRADLAARGAVFGGFLEGAVQHDFDVGTVLEAAQEAFAFGLVDAQHEFEALAFAHDLGAILKFGGHLFDEGAGVVHADAGLVGEVFRQLFVRGGIDFAEFDHKRGGN